MLVFGRERGGGAQIVRGERGPPLRLERRLAGAGQDLVTLCRGPRGHHDRGRTHVLRQGHVEGRERDLVTAQPQGVLVLGTARHGDPQAEAHAGVVVVVVFPLVPVLVLVRLEGAEDLGVVGFGPAGLDGLVRHVSGRRRRELDADLGRAGLERHAFVVEERGRQLGVLGGRQDLGDLLVGARGHELQVLPGSDPARRAADLAHPIHQLRGGGDLGVLGVGELGGVEGVGRRRAGVDRLGRVRHGGFELHARAGARHAVGLARRIGLEDDRVGVDANLHPHADARAGGLVVAHVFGHLDGR